MVIYKEPFKVITIILVGLVFNYWLNRFLKEWIAEPLDPKIFPNNKHNNYANPSGHSQFYSFLFFSLYFFYPDLYPVHLVVLFLYIRMIYLCLTIGYHTPKQLILGTLVGSSFAYLVYKLFLRL